MRISPIDFSSLSSLSDLLRFLDQFSKQVVTAINGNIVLNTNTDSKQHSVVFSQANTEVATIHSLGRVPIGYIVTSSSVACRVYNGSTANTASAFYLKSDTPATVGILLY